MLPVHWNIAVVVSVSVISLSYVTKQLVAGSEFLPSYQRGILYRLPFHVTGELGPLGVYLLDLTSSFVPVRCTVFYQ